MTERQAVKSVVVDLNAQHCSFIHRLFPNAKTSIDRFHIVQLVGWALDTERLHVLHGINEHMTQKNAVDLALSADSRLTSAYQTYQKLLTAIRHRQAKNLGTLFGCKISGIGGHANASFLLSYSIIKGRYVLTWYD